MRRHDDVLDAVNPSNQTPAPISCIQADEPGTDLIELFGLCQQDLRKSGIMIVGRRKQKKEKQARLMTDEHVDLEAPQKGKSMLSGSVSIGGIRVATSPSQEGNISTWHVEEK